MTAEQLEELLEITKFSSRMMLTADEMKWIISRVIAAEKLVEALGKIEKSWPELRKGLTDFGERQEFSRALAANISIARAALDSYREASK